VIDASGQALLPGFIDSHFHIDGDDALPALFLTRGARSRAMDRSLRGSAEIGRAYSAIVSRRPAFGRASARVPGGRVYRS
jgi:imidazolonepropionase-like amidohydrolase